MKLVNSEWEQLLVKEGRVERMSLENINQETSKRIRI